MTTEKTENHSSDGVLVTVLVMLIVLALPLAALHGGGVFKPKEIIAEAKLLFTDFEIEKGQTLYITRKFRSKTKEQSGVQCWTKDLDSDSTLQYWNNQISEARLRNKYGDKKLFGFSDNKAYILYSDVLPSTKYSLERAQVYVLTTSSFLCEKYSKKADEVLKAVKFDWSKKVIL